MAGLEDEKDMPTPGREGELYIALTARGGKLCLVHYVVTGGAWEEVAPSELQAVLAARAPPQPPSELPDPQQDHFARAEKIFARSYKQACECGEDQHASPRRALFVLFEDFTLCDVFLPGLVYVKVADSHGNAASDQALQNAQTYLDMAGHKTMLTSL